jgi:murein DD-endopeptidase MepM/ murein hydrolase activator NlpD
MARADRHIAVVLLLIVCAVGSYHLPIARGHVAIGSPVAYLISPPDPIEAERGEQSYRGRHTVPTPAPTPRATPVPPPPRTPEPRRTPTPAPTHGPVPESLTLSWPLHGPITTYFSAAHPAIDIAARLGTPVHAACPGKVIWSGWRNNGGGLVVDVRCDNGLTTSYNHLSAISAAVGVLLGSGALVGLVGATGNAHGSHLHFAVIRAGRFVNPLRYL